MDGDDGAWHEADLYRAVSPEGPYDPAVRYIGLMIEGAREHGLSEEYVARLMFHALVQFATGTKIPDANSKLLIFFNKK